MIRTAAAAALAAVFVASSATAQTGQLRGYLRSSQLADWCTRSGPGWDFGCAGYVSGTLDTLFAVQSASATANGICVPLQFTPAQAVTLFQEYLARHPEDADTSASRTLVIAVGSAFPCRKGAG